MIRNPHDRHYRRSGKLFEDVVDDLDHLLHIRYGNRLLHRVFLVDADADDSRFDSPAV